MGGVGWGGVGWGGRTVSHFLRPAAHFLLLTLGTSFEETGLGFQSSSLLSDPVGQVSRGKVGVRVRVRVRTRGYSVEMKGGGVEREESSSRQR